MSTTFELVNNTKKEKLSFPHLPVSTQNEICGHPVSSAIVSWYLINNRSDEIRFVSEFETSQKSEHLCYKEVTDEVISELIEVGIIKDEGFSWIDEDEPDTVYMRSLKNIWLGE